MLKIDNQNVNFSGQSFKDDVVIANFNGSSYGNTDINISVNVYNYNMDAETEEILYADMANFYKEIVNKVKTLAE